MHPLLTPWVTDCQCCWLSFSWAHADRNRVCRPPQVQGRWGRWKTEPAHRRWPQTSTWSDRLHKAHTLSHSSHRLLGWSTKSHDRECVWENVCVHRTVSVFTWCNNWQKYLWYSTVILSLIISVKGIVQMCVWESTKWGMFTMQVLLPHCNSNLNTGA